MSQLADMASRLVSAHATFVKRKLLLRGRFARTISLSVVAYILAYIHPFWRLVADQRAERAARHARARAAKSLPKSPPTSPGTTDTKTQ